MNTKKQLIEALKTLLGKRHVAVGKRHTEHFTMGWRSGGGEALAVVFPQTLVSFWQVLKLCVEADCIMIIQAANTGLTEGSTPAGNDYDREIIVINTLAMNKLILIANGEQVISLPGTTLHTLEKALKPLHRTPHSVIGSSCLGASIVGGIANNSGGALVQRGPAYTELSLYARVNAQGELELVNHLGVELGNTPETILTNLENKNFNPTDIHFDCGRASATDYVDKLRDVDADTPGRFNADPSKLYEASGCAGKIAIFAVRLDTFPQPCKEQTFYVGTNNPRILSDIRRDILSSFSAMPEVGEYMHRDCFDVAEKYGKDTFLSVKYLGTDRLPGMFAIKGKIDALLNRLPVLPEYLSERVMQGIAKLFPQHLPERMRQFRHRYEHHLILKMSDQGIDEARAYLKNFFASHPSSGGYFECDAAETEKAFLHRFAAAGGAMRYQMLNKNEVGDILALDIALRRNERDWVEVLPESVHCDIEKCLYYGHFFCHVFHQDYILKKGVNPQAVKEKILSLLDSRGAKYPAEHNVGHLYRAESALQDFYRELDPTNSFNPGIGKMEKHKRSCSCC